MSPGIGIGIRVGRNSGAAQWTPQQLDAKAVYDRMTALGEKPDSIQKKNLIDTIAALKAADLYNGQFDMLSLQFNGRGSSKLNIINEYESLVWSQVFDATSILEETIYSIRRLSNGDLLAGTGVLSGRVIRSIDNGVSWVDEGRILAASEDAVYDFCDLGSGIVLACTARHAHILRSTDYGHNWTDLGDLFGLHYATILVHLGNGIVICATEKSPTPFVAPMLRSTDYGLTWSDVGNASTDMTVINMLCNIGGGIVIAGGGRDDGVGAFADGRIIRSIDYGATWTDLGILVAGENRFFGSANCGNGIVLVGTAENGYILRSTDYGATWTNLGRVLPDTKSANSMFYLGEGVVLLGTFVSGGNGQILRSTNYGLTWENLGDLLAGHDHINGINYSNNTLFAVTSKPGAPKGAGIFRSTSNPFTRKTTNTYDLVEVANGGTLTFVPDSGFQSDGTKSYLKRSFTPYNSTPLSRLYKIADACFGFKVSGTIEASGIRAMGSQNLAGNIITLLGKNGATGYAYLNSAATTGAQPIDAGYNCNSRGVGYYKQFVNSDAYDITGAAVTGSQLDKEIFLLCYNEGGTPKYWVGANVVLEVSWCGRGMSQAKFLEFQTIINNYIANL